MAERIKYELTAINKTKAAFSGVQRGLGKMKAAVVNVKTAFAGLLAGAAIRSFVKGIQTAVDKLDLISKTAGKIGITTTALQELQVAADTLELACHWLVRFGYPCGQYRARDVSGQDNDRSRRRRQRRISAAARK